MKSKYLSAALIGLVLAATCISSNATIIKVDIGADGQQVQSGFDGLTGALTGTFSGITVTLSGNGTADFRDRNDVNGSQGDLVEDFFFATNNISLTLDNLAAGNYSFTSWHHDAGYTQSFVNIDSSGTDALNFQASTGFSPASIASRTIFFTSDGVGSDIIQFNTSSKVRSGASAVILSGFTVASIPEPTPLALLALGLFGLGLSRRKKA